MPVEPAEPVEPATLVRTRLMALALVVSTVAVTVGGMLWPEPAGGGDTYSYDDIAGSRGLWWGLLQALAVLAVINVPVQAIVTMSLLRRRGSTWATVGGCLMWVGAALQATGVAGWAAAYYYPTDGSLAPAVGSAVVEAANDDLGHLFGLMVPGALLVVCGTVVQCVGLLRGRVVPVWVPLALLVTVLTFVVPGGGALGLLTSIPMAAGAIALAWFAWPTDVERRTEPTVATASP